MAVILNFFLQYVNFYLKGIKYRHYSILAIDNWKINPGNCSAFNQRKTNSSAQQNIKPRSTLVRPEPIGSTSMDGAMPSQQFCFVYIYTLVDISFSLIFCLQCVLLREVLHHPAPRLRVIKFVDGNN